MNAARPTLRLRLAIHTMLVAGVLAAAIGAGAWGYARGQLERNLDLRVADAARRLWTQLTPRDSREEMNAAANATFGESALSRGAVAVLMQSHATGAPVVFASIAAPQRGFPARLPSGTGVVTTPDDTRPPAQRAPGLRPVMPEIRPPFFFTHADAGGEWRYVALSAPRATLFTGLSTRDFYAEVRRAAWTFIGAGCLALLLAGLGAWWLAGRAMRPLDRIVATVEISGAGALGVRIPPAPSDDREFARLIAALNAMMDRLQASFEQAARFTADASHELKTPLAIMHATLHDALRSGQSLAPGPLLDEVSRLKSITESLLLLSQADAGKLPIRRERLDLAAELAGIIEDAEALCAAAGLHCEHHIEPGIFIAADRALLRQVFRNLLANAVKYNRAGGAVHITLSRVEKDAVFTITNTGPGIPPELQPRLFERFFRADPARSRDGTGLGLNLAAELARANGATLALVESRPDHTALRLTIPALP